jgi:hypothetical protein
MKLLSNVAFWKEFYQEFVNECKELYNHNGFTYDIPSEEQIRSALYAFLRKKGYLVELESDLFRKDSKRVVGEYDLRVINKEYDLIVEVKRAWGLKNWSNKYKEFSDSWEEDISKLDKLEKDEYESEKINDNRKKCFVLAIFTNREDFHNKLKNKVDEFSSKLKGLELISNFEREILKGELTCNLFVWVEK